MSEQNETKIKVGCPFCGCKVYAAEFLLIAISKTPDGREVYTHRCPKCRTQFAFDVKNHDEAVALWNARPQPDWDYISAGELPEPGIYLTTVSHERFGAIVGCAEFKGDCWITEGDRVIEGPNRVIAWMPRPRAAEVK